MAYWDGKRWLPDGPTAAAARPRIGRRLFGATVEAALITLLMFGLIAGTTMAAKGGNGGKPPRDLATCQVDGNIVSAAGLPTSELINFMVSDGSGTTGWVLGVTQEGTWSVTVPEPSGPTTYEFVSRTSGPNGSRYSVYSSCGA
jgi:hypothetical protein